MTALEVLRAVAERLPGSEIRDERFLYVGEQSVAVAYRDEPRVVATAAVVFDGFKHVTGLARSITTLGCHRDPVGRVLGAIHERQAARAKSLPEPTPGPSRDPEVASAA